ncbi:MAG: purine-binding chemotaxis protein CheW [Actinobacteria bacterium]|nr:MAG: purine-binding chemotaxis protein CheW [Actinomycetota bacterium]
MPDFDIELERGRSLADTADEILRRRADSLARETLDEEISDQVSLLLFRIGEEWYAVRVGDVREIFQEYDITPIPCVPEFILGVVNVRGEILSITDPARLMRLGSVDTTQLVKPPAIVVATNDITTAMVVDEIGDIADVPNTSIEPPVSIIDRSQAEFVSGSAFIDGVMVGLVSIERALEPVVSGRH